MGCWEVLGITAEATEAEVRAAYARLLKQHRPDRDPAGFQPIRQAYEQALFMARRRRPAPAHRPALRSADTVERSPDAAEERPADVPAPTASRAPASPDIATQPVTDAPESRGADRAPAATAAAPAAATAVSAATTTAPPAPDAVSRIAPGTNLDPRVTTGVPALPADPQPSQDALALTAAVARLQSLIDEDADPDEFGDAMEALLALRRSGGARTPWSACLPVLAAAAARAPRQFTTAFSDAEVMHELQFGDRRLVIAILEQLVAQGDWDRLLLIARAARERLDELPMHAGQIVLLWLIPRLALVDYALASDLLRDLGRRAPANDAFIDAALLMGKDLATVPEESRRYVANLLISNGTAPGDRALARRTGKAMRLRLGTYVGRIIDNRFPAHFGYDLQTGRTLRSITFLGAVLTLIGIAAAIVFISVLTMWSGQSPEWITGEGIAGVFAILLALGFAHGLLVSPFEDRLLPWLDARIGPLDAGFLATIAWSMALCGTLMATITDDDGPFRRVALPCAPGWFLLLAAVAGGLLSRYARPWISYAPVGWQLHLPPWEPVRGHFRRHLRANAGWGLRRIVLGGLTAAILCLPTKFAYPELRGLWVVAVIGLWAFASRAWAAYLHSWTAWPARAAWAAALRLVAVCCLASLVPVLAIVSLQHHVHLWPGTKHTPGPSWQLWTITLLSAFVAWLLAAVLARGHPRPAATLPHPAHLFAVDGDAGTRPPFLVRLHGTHPRLAMTLRWSILPGLLLLVIAVTAAGYFGVVVMVALVWWVRQVVKIKRAVAVPRRRRRPR